MVFEAAPEPAAPAAPAETGAPPKMPAVTAPHVPARSKPPPPKARPKPAVSLPSPESLSVDKESGETSGAPPAGGGQAGHEETGSGNNSIGERAGQQGAVDAYLALIRQQIQQRLIYPPAARRLGLAGQVRLRFAILADGQVAAESLNVAGGSEASLLQAGAVETVRRIAAFPPPPAGAIGIEVPVLFSLFRQG